MQNQIVNITFNVQQSQENFNYHNKSSIRFPNDEQLKEIWLKFTNNTKCVGSKNDKICSEHFEADTIAIPITGRFKGIQQLKEGSVPSISPIINSPELKDNREMVNMFLVYNSLL